jgi:hypothetical protein
MYETAEPYRTRYATRSGSWKSRPASPKQVATIEKCLPGGEWAKKMDARTEAKIREMLEAGLTGEQASKWMDWLFAPAQRLPRSGGQVERKSTPEVSEEGIYRFTDGSVYRVVASTRSPGRFLAKMVTGHGWEYAKGMIFKLTPEMKMTPEQIAEFGVNSGVCAQCSRQLDDPVSKRIGLGTKCGPDILGRPVYNAARKAAKADPQVAEQLAAIEAGKSTRAEAEAQAAAFARRGEFPVDASFEVQELYWKHLAAQREAVQERQAEQAKADWKASVERF